MNRNTILKSGLHTSTGADIYTVKGLPAESRAALHALNSREPGGFKENIGKMFDDTGKLVERILGTFYVGYGHKSIGDCGEADIFIDGVSMLCANAFEHWPLFNGQETSSRYVDVTVNGFHMTEKLEGFGGKIWMNRWFDFYSRVQKALVDEIRKENPFSPEPCPEGRDSAKWEKSQKIQWEKATASRSFDIAGAFLPSGSKTNFSQVVNLRQWSDQIQILIHHPLEEVREVVQKSLHLLQRDHPNSFRISERKEKVEYNRVVAKHLFEGHWITPVKEFHAEVTGDLWNSVRGQILADVYFDRPENCDIPFDTARLGGFKVSSLVDYRSFRDLHRHRSATWAMPLVTPGMGFEKWYLDQLPEVFRIEAEKLIADYMNWYSEAEVSAVLKQLTTPMGFNVVAEAYVPFSSAVYIAELRSKLTVHPTARKWAISLGKVIQEALPDLKLHLCEDSDKFCLDRGKHDIVKKEG